MSSSSDVFGMTIQSRTIDCIKLSVGLCCRQRDGCNVTISAPSRCVSKLSVGYTMLVVARV